MKKIVIIIICLFLCKEGFSQVVQIGAPSKYRKLTSQIKKVEQEISMMEIKLSAKSLATDSDYLNLQTRLDILEEAKDDAEDIGTVNFLGSSGAGYTNNLAIPEVSILTLRIGEGDFKFPLNLISSLPNINPSDNNNEKATVDVLSPTGGILNCILSIESRNNPEDYTSFNFIFQPSIKLIQAKSRENDDMKYFGDINFNGYVKFQTAAWKKDNSEGKVRDGVFFVYTGFGWNIPAGGFRNTMFYDINNKGDYPVNFGSFILKAGLRVNQSIDISFGYVKCLKDEISLPRKEVVSISTNLTLNGK